MATVETLPQFCAENEFRQNTQMGWNIYQLYGKLKAQEGLYEEIATSKVIYGHFWESDARTEANDSTERVLKRATSQIQVFTTGPKQTTRQSEF